MKELFARDFERDARGKHALRDSDRLSKRRQKHELVVVGQPEEESELRNPSTRYLMRNQRVRFDYRHHFLPAQ